MSREEIFHAWVPELHDDPLGSPWTHWAKPILFANLPDLPSGSPPSRSPASPVVTGRPTWDRIAIVIDLPGREAVQRGLEFAEAGFRLIPLFNGCPGPGELIDTSEISAALVDAAGRLRELSFEDHAPPVFLLDARRKSANVTRRPGAFDNRWVVFPQDFPSGNLLLARGIESVLLIQTPAGQPQDDLAHVLFRWQNAGLRIEILSADGSRAEPLTVQRPARFRSLLYRLGAIMGLLPNSAGAFGGLIPQPSSG